MSTVLALQHTAPELTVLAGTGLLDTATEKIAEMGTLLRALAVIIGIGFVIYQAISSRGALARILVSALAAGVFLYVIFNVDALRDRVDNEVNAMGPVGTQQHVAVGRTVALTPAGGGPAVGLR